MCLRWTIEQLHEGSDSKHVPAILTNVCLLIRESARFHAFDGTWRFVRWLLSASKWFGEAEWERVDCILEGEASSSRRDIFVCHPGMFRCLIKVLQVHSLPKTIKALAHGGSDVVLYTVMGLSPEEQASFLKLCLAAAGDAAYELAWPGSIPDPTLGANTRHECPITLMPCVDPVLASDGYVYDRLAILTHLSSSCRSPMTREMLHPRVWRCRDIPTSAERVPSKGAPAARSNPLRKRAADVATNSSERIRTRSQSKSESRSLLR